MARSDARVIVINELEGFITDRMKRITRSTLRKLDETTPVLTGYARSQWIPSLGAPVTNPIGTRAQAALGDTNAQDSLRAASLAQINALPPTLRASIYVSNAATYIGDLNEGSSPKAPAGFIQAAVAGAIAENLA
jgi:hypothetical protein